MRSTMCVIGTVMMLMIPTAWSQASRARDTKGTEKADVEHFLASWKAKPQEVARKMISKYGQPNEATSMRLVWHNNGPWKRTELVNEEILHLFPKPHQDMLLQAIDFKVPPDKFDELAQYDGSVIAERTKGEMMARCDMEEANFLALNLAHDIITGKRSVDEARRFYAEAMREMKHPEYKQGFRFEVPKSRQGDPDKEVIPNQ